MTARDFLKVLISTFSLIFFLSSCQTNRQPPIVIKTPAFPKIQVQSGSYRLTPDLNLVAYFDLKSLNEQLKKQDSVSYSFQNYRKKEIKIKTNFKQPCLLLEHSFDHGSNLVLVDLKNQQQVILANIGLSRRHPQFGGYTSVDKIIVRTDTKSSPLPALSLTQTSIPGRSSFSKPGPPQERTYRYNAKNKAYLIQ